MNPDSPVDHQSHPPDTIHTTVRWVVREALGLVMLAIALFLSAGRLDWGMGWVLLAITALWVAATAAVVIPRNPDYLPNASGPGKAPRPGIPQSWAFSVWPP